jgi:phosphoserine phosphatase
MIQLFFFGGKLMVTMKPETAKERIPGDLLRRIESVETRFKNRGGRTGKKAAAFDMDNTLLIGDVGYAVFAQLKLDELKAPVTIDKKPIPLSWPEYNEVLRKKGKIEAYPLMARAMAGIPLEVVNETTHRVMTLEESYLEVEGERVTVPSPHPVMQALVCFLESLGYGIYVVSATNHFSVQYVAKEFFGIPEANAAGIKLNLVEHAGYGKVLGNRVEGPLTVEEGKIDAYRQLAGPVPPLITAGDSMTDIYLLNLVEPDGLVIWVYEDERSLETVKRQLKYPEILYFFKR